MSSKGSFRGEVNRRSTTDALKQPLKFNAETSTSLNTIQSEQTEKEGGKKPMVNPYAKPTGDKCYRCGIPGHRSNVFTKPRRQVNLTEYDENKNEDEDDYFKEDNGVCQPDRGEEDMPTFVVRKLKLPVEKHSESYSIVWITDGVGIRVTERCRIPLSIGKFYKDKVLCDVVGMNVCHLLFGRLWKYDLETTYDGKDNIHRFVKDGKKITLLPLGFKQNSESRTVENLLTISRVGTEFMGELKDSKEVQLLIVKEFLSIGRDEPTSKILNGQLTKFTTLSNEPKRKCNFAADGGGITSKGFDSC
ncbi:hypothetical protein Tco_1026624 [Tanacetum coccineum]